MCAPNTIAAKLAADPLGPLTTMSNPGGSRGVPGVAADIATKVATEAQAKAADLARSMLPPDATDKAVQAARKRQALLLTMGRGRSSTFVSGPAGDTSAKPLGYRSLLGGG